MGNEECKAARERAESIAVSHPPQSLPLRNHISAHMCRNALNDHVGFYSPARPHRLRAFYPVYPEKCPRPNGHIAT